MKKLFSILLALSFIFLASNAMAVTDTVKLTWDAWTAADGTKPIGFYIFRYTTDRATALKQDAAGPPNVVHSYTADFVLGTTYSFVAEAWAYGADGVTVNPSADSTPPVLFTYRGAGNHYPPTAGATIPAPTNFNVVDQTSVSWTRGAGNPVPVGYLLWRYKTSEGVATKQSSFYSGNVATAALVPTDFTLDVEYTMYVTAVVYGVDGISYVESVGSNTDVYRRTSGASAVPPTAPKGMKITP